MIQTVRYGTYVRQLKHKGRNAMSDNTIQIWDLRANNAEKFLLNMKSVLPS